MLAPMKRLSITSFSMLTVLLAMTLPIEVGAAPTATKTTKKTIKSKAAKKSAKKTPLRSVKMRRHSEPVVVPAAESEGTPPPQQDPPPNPFADMPSPPMPDPVGVTAESFTIAPRQLFTEHGSALVDGITSPYVYWGFFFKEEHQEMRIYPEWSWMQGRDLSLECWGDFEGGAMKVSASGYSSEQKGVVEIGSVVITPPAGNHGRIKVAIPTAGMSEYLQYFNLEIRDADRQNTKWSLYQCSVKLD